MNRSLQAKFDRSRKQKIAAAIDQNFSRGGAKALKSYDATKVKVKVAAPGKWSESCSLSNIKAERICREDGARRGSVLVYEDFGHQLLRWC